MSRSQLRRILREAEYWEADPPSHLGRFAFAPQRSKEGVPHESNLPVESRLLRGIRDYIISAERSISPDALDALLDVLRSKEYPDVFLQPTPDTMVFRGMHLGDEAMGQLARAMGMDPEDEGYGTPGVKYPVSFTFKPLTGRIATSWSRSMESAEEFTDNTDYSSDRVFGVVLSARAGDNPGKLLDLERIYKIADRMDFSPEREVMGFGDIRVSGLTIVYIA